MTDIHKKMQIALVGAGAIGRQHLSHIMVDPDVALHAIVDSSPGASAIAAQYCAPWYSDLDAMLANGRPDGVIVATPNQLHVEHGLKAIAAGIPVLVEKPLADNLAAAQQLVLASEKAGVPLLTGHHRRHNPVIAHAKTIVDSGRLGRIIAMHGFFWLMKPDDYFDVAWRRAPGAGPVLTNLIHDIDVLRHLCGEVEAVQAFQSSAVRGFDVDETTVVTLKFANGALGTMNISDTVVSPWSWEHTASENTAYPRTDQTCLYIAGTHGALSVPRLEVWSNKEKRSWWEPFTTERTVAAEDNPLRRQIRQFCRVIRGEERPLVSGREGMLTLQVIDAVQRAAKSGETVSIKTLPVS
ncbi:MAG: Gfo/Idh/MocA family protein [Beijerinckiaceae bacterium]